MTRQQDKQRTRLRISDTATALFLDRGFDAVTVAEVAAAAGVSKVTVFAHFARKEDLLLDRGPEATELVRRALADGAAPMPALRALALELARERHPLSGLRGDSSARFLDVIAASPALQNRTRELLADLETALADALPAGPDAPLVAALVVSSYRTVVVRTVADLLAGRPVDDVAAEHVTRLSRSFDALDAAVAALAPGPSTT